MDSQFITERASYISMRWWWCTLSSNVITA